MATILVADDNSNIQKMVSLALAEHGVSVIAVGNGEAAVRKVPEVCPDVVLADVFMPVRNGYEVCEFVKKDTRFAQTPVILLVGAFDPLDEKEARRVGADGILKKPFVPPDPLIAMVRSLLEKLGKPMGTPEPKEEVKQASMPIPAVPRGSNETVSSPKEFPEEPADAEIGAVPTWSFSEPVVAPKEIVEEESEPVETGSDWRRRRDALEFDIPGEAEELEEEEPGAAVFKPSFLQEDSEAARELLADESEPTSVETGREEKFAGSPTEWLDMLTATEAGHETSEESPGPPPAAEQTDGLPSHHGPRPWGAGHWEREAATPPGAEAQVETPEATSAIEPGNAIPAKDHSEFFTTPTDVLPFRLPGESNSVAGEPHTQAFAEGHAAANDTIRKAVEESIAEAPHPSVSAKAYPQPSPAPTTLDPAMVDMLVAKVVEKIEPQIQQVLAEGILRPLVENMLRQELENKGD